ncbi:MAG: LysE family transporter [Chloroflexota bacterium]
MGGLPASAAPGRELMDVDAALLLRGVVLGATIAAAVGPISLLVIRRTIAEGRVVGLASGMGVATADGAYGAVAAFGLTAVTQVLVDWRRVLALAGGLFLLWLAWRLVRSVPDAAARVPRRGGLAGAYLTTLGLTLTNPMTILSFAALFVGLGVTGGDVAGAATLTAGVFLGSAVWWVVLITLVGALRSRVTPTWLRRINVASGLLIGAFALVALVSTLG